MYKLTMNKDKSMKFLITTFIFLLAYLVGKKNYLIFHTFTEMTAIVLGLSLMIISLGTMKLSTNNYFQLLAIIFGLAGIIDLLHILEFKGVYYLSDNPNITLQLGSAARVYECVMLNLSSIYIDKKFNWYKLFIINCFIVILFLSSILVFNVFPPFYIDGYGISKYKIIIEYLTAVGFFIILIRVIKSKKTIYTENRSDIVKSTIFKILTSVCLILSAGLFNDLDILGNVFKAVSYYYAFRVIYKYMVENPYTILFEQLNNKVSELEKANDELMKARDKAQGIEELHNKFVNFIPDGVLVIRNKKIESVNNTFLKMLEVDDKDELRDMSIFEVIDSSWHDVLSSRINWLRESVLEVPQQYIFTWKNKKKWVEVSSLIVNDEGGEYMISTLRSIEDRKKAEEAEQLLELKKKEESMKNDFFTNISHELRTPINVIYSALQVENDCLKNGINKEAIVKYNKIIRQNCLRLMRLINNLIDITRIETSFFQPNFKIDNIIALVEDITMSIVQYVESKNINLIFDTEIEEAYVKFDPDLIERIILNLLSNAVKYGREGGNIDVYICESEANKISISIKDDGVGIPDDKKERVFDRFLKIDASLSRKTEGSGIGLALVKQLVEMHKGTISFNSKLNEGTEFIIILPTLEYASEVCVTIEKSKGYEQNIIESAEIEFSDIYY